MATSFFKINGVDWAPRISDITPIVKENKSQKKNLRGDVMITPQRAAVNSTGLLVTIPYLTKPELDILKAMITATNKPVIDHNFDFTSGTMNITDFQFTLVKNLEQILYTAKITFSTNVSNATSPNPTSTTAITSVNVTQRLGLY